MSNNEDNHHNENKVIPLHRRGEQARTLDLTCKCGHVFQVRPPLVSFHMKTFYSIVVVMKHPLDESRCDKCGQRFVQIVDEPISIRWVEAPPLPAELDEEIKAEENKIIRPF